MPNRKTRGEKINWKKAEEFVVTMQNCDLLDLSFQGPKFTWTSKRKTNPILERLDRGWGNPKWFTTFSNSCLWHLPRITSDHCPLLIQLNLPIPSLGVKPFRFEPMWLLHENFCPYTSQHWPITGATHCFEKDLPILAPHS